MLVRATFATPVGPMLALASSDALCALEFDNGGEQHDLCQALATIITAQLSTLFAVSGRTTPHGLEDWERQDRSLVAS